MPYHKSLRPGLFLIISVILGLLLTACGQSSPEINLSLAPTETPAPPTPTSAVTVAPRTTAAPTQAQTTRGNNPATTGAANRATVTPNAARNAPTPRPAIQPLSGFSGKITLLGPERALYIARFDGKTPQLVLGNAGVRLSATQDGSIYDWPTWSKDGSKLAVMAYNIKSGNVSSADIFVVGSDGKNPYKVQSDLKNAPIFMSWSPDGSLLSLLTNNTANSTMELSLLDNSKGATAAPAVRKIAEGSAIYTGWSPDSQQLVIHANSSSNNSGTVGVLAAKDSKAQVAPLKNTPGTFRVASFSHDGSRLAYVGFNTQQSNDEILVQDKAGASLGSVTAGGKGATLIWSPTNPKIAHTYQIQSNQAGFYKGIFLTELDVAAKAGSKFATNQIVDEQVLAFFWSPDGKKLAYVGVNESGSFLTWNVYDLATRKSTFLAEWYPNTQLMQLFTYFDQYAQGHSLWSPDSKALVFGGFSKEEVTAYDDAEDDSDLMPTVFVLPTEGAQAGKLLPVASGYIGFWSK